MQSYYKIFYDSTQRSRGNLEHETKSININDSSTDSLIGSLQSSHNMTYLRWRCCPCKCDCPWLTRTKDAHLIRAVLQHKKFTFNKKKIFDFRRKMNGKFKTFIYNFWLGINNRMGLWLLAESVGIFRLLKCVLYWRLKSLTRVKVTFHFMGPLSFSQVHAAFIHRMNESLRTLSFLH